MTIVIVLHINNHYYKSKDSLFYVTKERSSEDNRLRWWTMTGSNCRHPACKAGALPAELIVHIGDPSGNRTRDTAVKGRCLNRLTNGPYEIGSSSRTRTYDRSVNSRLLYQLSYRGMYGAGNEIRTRDPRLGKAVLYR